MTEKEKEARMEFLIADAEDIMNRNKEKGRDAAAAYLRRDEERAREEKANPPVVHGSESDTDKEEEEKDNQGEDESKEEFDIYQYIKTAKSAPRFIAEDLSEMLLPKNMVFRNCTITNKVVALPCNILNILKCGTPEAYKENGYEEKLGLSYQEFQRVAYCDAYIILKSCDAEHPVGTLLKKEDPALRFRGKDFVVEFGPNGLRAYAESKGVYLDCFMVSIPVILPEFPEHCDSDALETNYRSVLLLYNRVIVRANRYRKLEELKCPEIIIQCEMRMLQEHVDSLLYNGMRGLPIIWRDGNGNYMEEIFASLHDFMYEEASNG